MIAKLGWGTFLFYAVADVITLFFVWFCLQETRGLSLEQIDNQFRKNDPAVNTHKGIIENEEGRESVDKQPAAVALENVNQNRA